MARSQLLKDTVSGKEKLENILLRLKIILSDLDNDLIMQWIQGELQGYEEDAELPGYRKLKGNIVGNYILNGRAEISNSSVPLSHLVSLDEIEKLRDISITDSVKTLEEILSSENKENFGSVIPASYCHAISNVSIQIIGMRVKCPSNLLSKVVSNVKSKLVDVILELENQYENLDELDIKSQVEEDVNKKKEVIFNIEKIIYDESIKLGDKNKVKESRIGSWLGGKK
ncbi:hypothetical protein LB312_05750 [Bacillus tropicus]|uniref:AbiTii domain-containing protein n=1 Tax=Bacillus tropicus TaxID=2026188 RepID=UPI001E4860C5|nr:hypothetical protein [Bacillus tropicus]MCC1486763.1 hypothetical protein [Bacillus tropicus]